MKKILAIAVAAIVVIGALGIGAWLIWGGEDDVTARGTCGGATYEISAEDEDGATEVTFELQSGAPGEVWQVLIEQDGAPLLEGERTTDEDGELDVDAIARGDAGEEFTATATRTGDGAAGETCVATVSR